jgi:hypothetical protein
MSLLITTAKLMEIIYEEIEEALTAGWETIYDDPEEPEERTGDLPAAEPLVSPLPSKEDPDPYPIHPSPQAMAMAMDWYRVKNPRKYKRFIKDKGPQDELDRIKRSILGAAREIDAAKKKPTSPEQRLAVTVTKPMSQVGEGIILRQYIKEELETYLAEVHSEEQRTYMCTQANLPDSERKKGLSKAQAEEMCHGPMKES